MKVFLILLFFLPHFLLASAKSHYQTGISAFQQQKFDEASLAFSQAYHLDNKNKWILYNWGLSEFKQNKLGMAIATWRKALALDPNFSTAQKALSFLLKKNGAFNPTPSLSAWESLRSHLLVHFSLYRLLAITAVLLLIGGWLSIKYLASRRKALDNELPLPTVHWVALIFDVFFVVFLALSILKTYDHNVPRATVVVEVAKVYSAPNQGSAPLLELLAGFEVIINMAHNEWTQITYPGGLTGWVKKENLFHTSGRQPW